MVANSPFSGRGRGEQIAHCSYCRHEIPSDTLNCLFPSNIPSKDIQFFPNLPASKNWPEEQIFWGTGSLGAPDHVNIWDWDKVNRIPSVVQYRIVFSFHLAKRINPPDPGWDRNERYCPLFGNRLLGVKLIRREQNSRWTFTQAKTSFISGVKTGSMLVYRPCDCTSGNLNKTSVREKPMQRCLSENRLRFSELFDDISLCWTRLDYAWLWMYCGNL